MANAPFYDAIDSVSVECPFFSKDKELLLSDFCQGVVFAHPTLVFTRVCSQIAVGLQLDDGDLALFESKREAFLKKYEKEIKAYRTERLIGSGALRDYNFSSLPENILKNLDSYPPFNGYVYQNGILCAKIKIEDKYFYLPPIYDEDYR